MTTTKGNTRNHYYGARYYHPKWSVWLGVDPLAGEFQSLTPYHFVANNPLNIVDPNGMDTLILHRSELLTLEQKNELFGNLVGLDWYGDLDVYELTFSVMKNGKENKVEGRMFMYGNKFYRKIGALPDQYYTLKFDKMSSGKHRNNDIRINGGIFLHPGKNYLDYKGCFGVSLNKPFVSESGDLTFPNSPIAQQGLRDMYDLANGGVNGNLLTGEMFLLKTNSRAMESIIELKSRELDLTETD